MTHPLGMKVPRVAQGGTYPPQVHVRAAASDDIPALAEVAARTFPLACPAHVTAEVAAGFVAQHLSASNFQAYLADPAREVLVAEADGSLLGYAMLVFGEPYDADAAAAIRLRPTVELSKCYVVPEAHGTGVAHELMAATLRAASARGAAGVWLGVNEQNVRAIRYYTKCGFQTVGRKHFTVGHRVEDDYVLERPIRHSPALDEPPPPR